MANLLIGKVIVVTGGVGLLGKEFLQAVIENGGVGVIADINEIEGLKFKEQLSNIYSDSQIDFFKLDITSKESIKDCIDYLYKKYVRIDALVNAAYPRNKNYGKRFEDVTYEDFCENVNLHLGGYFLTSQQFALFFKKQGYGNIVNIASIYGVVAPKFEIYEGTDMTMPVEYAVIKSAVIHLTKYMAKYFKGYNIRINCISPGGIFDKQPESFIKKYSSNCLNKGMLNKDDLKGTLIYLLSDMSRFVNGQNIVVDDGFTL